MELQRAACVARLMTVARVAVLLLVTGAVHSGHCEPAPADAPVVLDCFMVEADSPPAFLEIGFRHHLIWGGVRSLTFRSVPAAWARAGIRIGDRVVMLDGHAVDGMSLRKELFPLLQRKFAPLQRKEATSVSFKFEIESAATLQRRTVELVLKANNAFTIGT